MKTDPTFPLQFLHKGCQDYQRLYKVPRNIRERWTCGALWGSFGINWDGTIYPCHRMIGKGWEIGHIQTDIDPRWIDYYRSLNMSQCHFCPNFSCGTCYVVNYHTTGSIHTIPPDTCAFESTRNQLVREIHPHWSQQISLYEQNK